MFFKLKLKFEASDLRTRCTQRIEHRLAAEGRVTGGDVRKNRQG